MFLFFTLGVIFPLDIGSICFKESLAKTKQVSL